MKMDSKCRLEGFLPPGESVTDEARECELPPGVKELSQAVTREARSRGLRICCAESCTGGLLAGAVTENAGSSDIFTGGVVCYSNESKIRILKVPERIIERYGAVSEECALAMARGARDLFGSDIACSVTGIAGPGGATPGKPVGLVWFGVVSSTESSSFSRQFQGDRGEIRKMAVASALEALLRSAGRMGNDR